MLTKASHLVASLFLLWNISSAEEQWWKHGVFYQIYPRSFKDSNNDGNGDLAGVIQKLPYLQDTGIDAIWLSPIMKSPQVDAGYDISDYYSIDEMYGNLEDLKKLVETAHQLGLKVLMDFVPNHTSDQHKWFQESENGNEEYKDYYVWVDAKEDGKPPNNWLSVFRGSAWQWSDKRKQFYLHDFVKEQPDLNYRNPKVQEEMKKILIFYLDLGIDGFRVDAVPFIFEDEQLRDEPRSFKDVDEDDFLYLNHLYTQNLPGTYKVVEDWRKVVDNYSETHDGSQRILMTEAYGTVSQMFRYYGTKDGSKLGAHISFNFLLIDTIDQKTSTARDLVQKIREWQDYLPSIYTSNWVLGNHDHTRIPTRLGVKNIDGFNMLIQLLPGISVTYNGDEFGQEDGEVSYEEGKDPSARDPKLFAKISRDFERTPLQWDDSINAGFNEGAKTWLPVSQKYKELNLASQLNEDELSHYQIFKKLIQKRKEDAARIGSTNVWAISDDVIVVQRSFKDKHIVLAFKLGWNDIDDEEIVHIPSVNATEAVVFLTNVESSYEIGSKINPQNFTLRPHESLVLDLYSQ